MSTDGYDSTKESFDSAKKVAGETFDKAKDAANETFEDFKDAASKTVDDLKNEYNNYNSDTSSKRVLAGILGIFLGYLGIHKFVLGYTKEGVIQLIAGVLTCGTAGIIGVIEGIIYLTKSEKEFYQTYQVNKKPWF